MEMRRWTDSAIECYKRGCRCSGCTIKQIYPQCRMKNSVIQLVAKFGKPIEKQEKDLII